MTIRNCVASLPVWAAALVALGGCKKNVDPSQFDAGASAAPVVATADTAATAAAAPSAPAPTDSVAPLASLSPPATPPPAGAGAAAKPKKNLPECEQARKFCNHPAVKVDKAIENLCTQNKQSCFAKGGTL